MYGIASCPVLRVSITALFNVDDDVAIGIGCLSALSCCSVRYDSEVLDILSYSVLYGGIILLGLGATPDRAFGESPITGFRDDCKGLCGTKGCAETEYTSADFTRFYGTTDGGDLSL